MPRRGWLALSYVLLLGAVAVGCDDFSTNPLAVDAAAMPQDGPGEWTPYVPPKPVMYVHSGTELYKIDPDTLVLSLVGSFGENAPHMTDLAVTPDGRVYTLSLNNLYEINPITAAATWIAKVPGTINVALTFEADGTLLASDKQGSLTRVDPKTGAIHGVGFYGAGYGSAGDLVATKDGTLYGVNDAGEASKNNELIKVDPATGKATTVGKIGFRLVWGLAFWGGTVYGTTASGQLLAIDPQTGAGRLISTHNAEFWGAGVTPLAPLTIK